MHALVITRADAASGYGHLRRTLALAQHLRKQQGFQVQTLLIGDEEALQNCREQGGQAVFFPSWELKWAVRRELLADLIHQCYPTTTPQLVIFDHYDFSDTYWARSLFTDLFPDSIFFGLDIYRHRSGTERPERKAYRPVKFQWIVNSLHAPFGRSHSRHRGTRLFFGTDYLILPPEISQTPRWQPADDAPVVVYLHGRTPRAIHRLVSALADAGFSEHRFRIFTNHSELLSQYINPRVAITELVPQDEFLATFTKSCFGITSAGFSLYELAYLGVPLVIVPVSVAEFGSAEKFVQQGCGELVSVHGRGFKSRLRAALDRISDRTTRSQFSERGRKLIDDQGLLRVAALIEQAAREASSSPPPL